MDETMIEDYKVNQNNSITELIVKYLKNHDFSILKLMRFLNISLIFSIIFVIAYMFHLKGYVQDLVFEKKQVKKQIDNDKDQINLLRAELAYLKSPERLKVLVIKYLDLNQATPQQIQQYASDKGNKKKNLGIAKASSKSKWRYKSNIMTVSNQKAVR